MPAGKVDEGEELEQAAGRELREEAGATAERLEYLGVYHPCNGSTNLTFHVYIGHGVQVVGELTDTNEVMRAAWYEPEAVWQMIAANQIRDGLTLTALLWHFARIVNDTMTR
ncbi:MAG TPA: NUDIX hydrolase [Roseiflexaceae bacterium]|nr:NUDIX hydrolase [Roseiflexaceae bacterium]